MFHWILAFTQSRSLFLLCSTNAVCNAFHIFKSISCWEIMHTQHAHYSKMRWNLINFMLQITRQLLQGFGFSSPFRQVRDAYLKGASDSPRDRAVWRGLFTEMPRLNHRTKKSWPCFEQYAELCFVKDIDVAPLSRQERRKMKKGGGVDGDTTQLCALGQRTWSDYELTLCVDKSYVHCKLQKKCKY